MATASTYYTESGQDFTIPANEQEAFDATNFLIDVITALENHDHASGRGKSAQRFTTVDDVVSAFGTSGDTAHVHRSTALGANTALTSALIGTPVTQATPADSLIVSNITANGDISWFLNDTSGNSWEYLRFDGSAKQIQVGHGGGTQGIVLVPAANDGVALGTGTLMWADLFLASGAVVNFNNGDVTLTHALNTLTLAGGNLTVGANSFTAGSVLVSSNDAGALGASGTAWADLFLASGGVINWNAGDVTVTHSANTLAFAGASSGYTFDADIRQSGDASVLKLIGGVTGGQKGASVQLYGSDHVNNGLLELRTPRNDNAADIVRLSITGDVAAGSALITLAEPTVISGASLDLGVAGSVLGTLKINGSTSGTITIVPGVAAGTWSWTLPPDDGDAGEQLQTNGVGVTTWEAAASLRAFKHVLGRLDPAEALRRVLAAPVHEFRYKTQEEYPDGRITSTGDHETLYAGVMADEAPWVMHHKGRIFSPVSAFGHAAAAIQELAREVADLKIQIASMQAGAP